MITKVDIIDLSVEENIFTIKIIANHNCYSKFDFCNSYVQKINNKTTALFNVLNSAVTVFCSENADFNELNYFFNSFCISTVFCESKFKENFKFPLKLFPRPPIL